MTILIKHKPWYEIFKYCILAANSIYIKSTRVINNREDIFVAAARKELEYIIKVTYSNLVYSLYKPLYSFNTLVLLLNSIFVKTCFDALVIISL